MGIMDVKRDPWVVMYKDSPYATPMVRRSCKTKEEAVAALNELVDGYRNDPCYQFEDNKDDNVVIELAENSYLHIIKHDTYVDRVFVWVAQQEEDPAWLQEVKKNLADANKGSDKMFSLADIMSGKIRK